MTGDQPPPLPETVDEAFLNALEHGPAAPLSVYRRAYAIVGIPWPGEQEARRRHRITEAGPHPPPTSLRQLSWPNRPDGERADQSRTAPPKRGRELLI